MVLYCARCGAELATAFKGQWWETNPRCSSCGVAAGPRPILAPSNDETAYDLVEWALGDRALATDCLVELGIPYRWEADVVLVVSPAAARRVDAILDDIEAQPAEPGGGPAGDDGGHQAHHAMSDLFIAADGLDHAVGDTGRRARFIAAAGAIAPHALAPYGIEAAVWQRIRTDSAGIAGALQAGADDESVLTATRALRTLLRGYV